MLKKTGKCILNVSFLLMKYYIHRLEKMVLLQKST